MSAPRRSDTLAAQVAALDMVMVAIDEGRDMPSFVKGMLTVAKEARDAALNAEEYEEVYPVGTAYANRIAAALDAKYDPDPYGGDNPDEVDDGPPTGYPFAPTGEYIGHKPEPCDGFTAANAWGPCAKCGLLLGEHEPTGTVLTDPFSDAISVRAAFAFGDWPPKTPREQYRDKLRERPNRWGGGE